MRYRVSIANVSTCEIREGMINHSDISAFARKLAFYNWMLIEHSRLAANTDSKCKEIIIGKERVRIYSNNFNVVPPNIKKEVRNNEDGKRIIESTIS